MAIKKSKKLKANVNESSKHKLQENVCSNLKAVYFSKDEASIKRFIENFSEFFIKVNCLVSFNNFFSWLLNQETKKLLLMN